MLKLSVMCWHYSELLPFFQCILVSGHDIMDLQKILVQAEKQGIDVYTHGELLPAHGYPKLREFKVNIL